MPDKPEGEMVKCYEAAFLRRNGDRITKPGFVTYTDAQMNMIIERLENQSTAALDAVREIYEFINDDSPYPCDGAEVMTFIKQRWPGVENGEE